MPHRGAKVVSSTTPWCTERVQVRYSRGADISSLQGKKETEEENVLRVYGESERKERWAAGCPSFPSNPEENNTVLYTVLKHDI